MLQPAATTPTSAAEVLRPGLAGTDPVTPVVWLGRGERSGWECAALPEHLGGALVIC